MVTGSLLSKAFLIASPANSSAFNSSTFLDTKPANPELESEDMTVLKEAWVRGCIDLIPRELATPKMAASLENEPAAESPLVLAFSTTILTASARAWGEKSAVAGL